MERRSRRKTKAQKKASRVKRRGAKRCPACNCNTFSNGGCSCGYGRKHLSIPEIENGMVEAGGEALAIAVTLITKSRRNRRMRDQEDIGTTGESEKDEV